MLLRFTLAEWYLFPVFQRWESGCWMLSFLCFQLARKGARSGGDDWRESLPGGA